MKTLSVVSRICCLICAVLMLGLILCQFVPYWTVDDETISMAEMIWMPKHHKNFTTFFKSKVDKNYKINDLVDMPIVSMIAAAVGFFFCLLKSKVWKFALLPIISGSAMLIALTEPVQKIGLQYSSIQILSIVTVAVAAVGVITGWIVTTDLAIAERKAFKKVKAAKAAAREAAVAARSSNNV